MRPIAPSNLLATLLALAALPSVARPLDLNQNGMDDALEDVLLQRFAPVVILAPGESALPANVDWYLARAVLDPVPAPKLAFTRGLGINQAALLGDWFAILRKERREPATLRPGVAARPGSSDPRDWVVYGHVYSAQNGDWLLQYWFFYPFNDGHFFFDHEGDWEHITVRLDDAYHPLGAFYARHGDCAPGPWFDWARLTREGEHPVVLSARGTHASYPSASEARWYDRTCDTLDLSQAAARGCRIWRTGRDGGAGGVAGLGQRFEPRAGATFIGWPGEWGATGAMGRSGGSPLGPAFQAGWCALAGRDCN